MTQLLEASKNLATRPADEHFATFRDLRNAALADAKQFTTVVLPPEQLQVVAEGAELRVRRAGGSAKSYPMTSHSARAICRLAGASPEFVFERLSPQTAATALTEGLARGEQNGVQLMIGTVTGADGVTQAPRLRAVTSPTYCRVWDADVYAEVDRWLLGAGYVPALPTKNTDAQRNNILGNNKPALFRGDRDSFSFFMHEETAAGAGDRPVRRGVFVKNSEVGSASLAPTRFLFDDICANFIVWGAAAMKTLRIIHRGRSEAHLLRRFTRELRECAPTIAAEELRVLSAAAEKQFAPSIEVAADRLNIEFGLSKAQAELALQRATWAENRQLTAMTHAWVANGVTSLAKETTYADSLVELATIGGDIYLAGAV